MKALTELAERATKKRIEPEPWMYEFAKWVSAHMGKWSVNSIETECIVAAELCDYAPRPSGITPIAVNFFPQVVEVLEREHELTGRYCGCPHHSHTGTTISDLDAMVTAALERATVPREDLSLVCGNCGATNAEHAHTGECPTRSLTGPHWVRGSRFRAETRGEMLRRRLREVGA